MDARDELWPVMLASRAADYAYEPADLDMHWLSIAPSELREAHIVRAAAFVRANVGVPAEALYRWSAGRGMHPGEPSAWETLPFGRRLALTLFCNLLWLADIERLAEDARLAAAAPAPQPPNMVREDETIMARAGSILDRVDDAPRMINLGGPADAAPLDNLAASAGGALSEGGGGGDDGVHSLPPEGGNGPAEGVGDTAPPADSAGPGAGAPASAALPAAEALGADPGAEGSGHTVLTDADAPADEKPAKPKSRAAS